VYVAFFFGSVFNRIADGLLSALMRFMPQVLLDKQKK